jgi:hypothetical protein
MTITARLASMAATPATSGLPVPLVQPWAAKACQVTSTGSTDNSSPSAVP